MVKAYQRYAPSRALGLIADPTANALLSADGRIAYAPAGEAVILWNIRTGLPISRWADPADAASAPISVTSIASNASESDFAVGYSDGSIRIWSPTSTSSSVTFNGHRSAVTCLHFSKDSTMLVSGAKDTDVIVWDLVAECGIYRLRGHNGPLVQVRLLETNGMNHLVSASKDSIIKIWDLATQHCVETIVASRGELWSVEVDQAEDLLVSGGSDPEVRVWRLDSDAIKARLSALEDPEPLSSTAEPIAPQKSLQLYGSIVRQSKDKLGTVKFHNTGRYLVLQNNDKCVEVYIIRTEEEVRKKIQRRIKRQKEKQQKQPTTEEEPAPLSPTIADHIALHHIIRPQYRPKSISLAPTLISSSTTNKASESFQILISTHANTIELHNSVLPSKESPSELVTVLDAQGHRTDLRVAKLNEDNSMMLTGSNGQVKIWNLASGQAIRSLYTGYVLSGIWVGDKYIIVGTKEGRIDVFDLGSSECVESIQAHEGPVWSLDLRPDGKGFVSGSGDKDVKEWDFGTSTEDLRTRLTLTHMRTLRMSEDVLCVKYSPSQRFLAISLLDSTVKIFYHDTLKFFLSLYGHKLPVLALDMSSDNALIVTASADKSIKIWGMDFGDCHRSLIAGEDSITGVKFVWGTHYAFTVCKDKKVTYWDLDRFEAVQSLHGHLSEVWALDVGKWGNVVVSAGGGREIRVWDKTDEQMFLEEEREKLLEKMHEEELVGDEKYQGKIGSGVEGNDSSMDQDTVGSATKKTVESLKGGEKIMEAIDVWESERAQIAIYLKQKAHSDANPDSTPPALPPRSPWIVAIGKMDISPEEYVLRVIEKISSAELEEALLILGFQYVRKMLEIVYKWIRKDLNIALSTRILIHLLKTHTDQITNTQAVRPTLIKTNKWLRRRLEGSKHIVGLNLAGLVFLNREYRLRHEVSFGDDDNTKDVANDGEKKRKRFTLSSG